MGGYVARSWHGIVINNVTGITYFRYDNDCLIRSARVFWNPAAIAANATP
jgi:hypothetical protein